MQQHTLSLQINSPFLVLVLDSSNLPLSVCLEMMVQRLSSSCIYCDRPGCLCYTGWLLLLHTHKRLSSAFLSCGRNLSLSLSFLYPDSNLSNL